MEEYKANKERFSYFIAQHMWNNNNKVASSNLEFIFSSFFFGWSVMLACLFVKFAERKQNAIVLFSLWGFDVEKAINVDLIDGSGLTWIWWVPISCDCNGIFFFWVFLNFKQDVDVSYPSVKWTEWVFWAALSWVTLSILCDKIRA